MTISIAIITRIVDLYPTRASEEKGDAALK